MNTATHLLAKYLNPTFSTLTANEYSVKCFFDFEVVNYDHNLAVELLFTNIPLDETTKNCANDLFSKNF